MRKIFQKTSIAALATFGMATMAYAEDIKLPSTIVWTAYNTGTSGYNQAVGIGSVIKNKYGTNLRVIPGKNDVSRLSPVKSGVAQFSATGSDSIYAQEAVYVFGTDNWGPQPIRLIMHNLADGCAASLVTAKDANIKTIPDLKGKRVAWVRGASSLNQAMTAYMAHANMTWDDVEKVEVGGYGASIDALINNDLDALIGATFSSTMRKIDASPRGLYHPPAPHGDTEGWSRLNGIVPWYYKHLCMAGPGVPKEGYEGVGTGYPILVTTTKISEDVAYNMTKAMYVHFDDYKDSAPGATGWAWERQKIEESFMPFHDGAVKYYKEAGHWTDKAQARQDANLKRQAVLMNAWEEYKKSAPSDDEGFNTGWMKARADALKAEGMIPVFEKW
ncbi:MAG: TAXI family TRAP transporter solute-binding subunit [Sneathiella sp.]|nr:TAXI family TRAP transporter solute-binding subunit [Sneathiella sp.]